MRDYTGAHVEMLADELKRLTGWGVEPSRLASKPVLRDLARVAPSLPRVTAGCIIRRYLVAGIESIGDRDYLGRRFTAHKLSRELKLELAVEQSDCTAPARQYRTMQTLELDYSYDQWRRHPRLQRGLMVLLAEHLVQSS
jgi:hypothetical protein